MRQRYAPDASGIAGVSVVAAGCLRFVVDTLSVDSRVAYYSAKCEKKVLGNCDVIN